MPSRGGVINAALHHLGEPESDAPLTDDSQWVARIRNRYDERAQALFERHYWNFATSVSQLAATEPTPDGWDFGFNKPPKCWCMIRVTPDGRPMGREIMFEDQGGRVLTNEETTFLHFVNGDWLTKEGSWPQVFADALASDLALRVSPVTTASTPKRDELKALAKDELRIAKNWDAIQTRYAYQQPSAWQASRFSGIRGRGDC